MGGVFTKLVETSSNRFLARRRLGTALRLCREMGVAGAIRHVATRLKGKE